MVMNSVVRDEALATKPWEQPLTTADMRARAAEWSLADDSRLLAYLEVLTQSITLRTCSIHKQLEGLVHQAMISGVKVHNVINDFSHLNSLQFVENRVYDEEVQADAKDAQPPCREEEEGALVEQVSEAFRLGVEVLRSSLEVVDLHQDSEDDDDSDEDTRFRHAEETLLRPLDPYLARPLPSLIGSDQFLRDDCVGLGELLSEDEGEEKSSHGEYDSDKSEVGSDTDEAKEPVIDNKMAIYMQQEFRDTLADSNDADKFAGDAEELYSDGSDEVSVLKSKERKESAVLSEGCAKVEDVLESSQTLVGQSAQMENASPFSRKSGPFSGSGKLFDDDDNDCDEGDLFRDGLTSRPPNKAGAASFGNEEQNTSIEGVVCPDASAGSEENVIVSMAQNTTGTREVLASALFDEEDYSDLWTSTPTRGLPGLSPSEDQGDKCSLFDDGQDDLFPTTNAAVKTGSKLERSLFSDEEEDIFASAKSALAVSSGHPTKPDLFVNSTVETKCRTSSTGIFLFEDDSDGLRTACPAALEKPQGPVKAYGRRPTNEPISLFATEEEVGDDDEDLFTVPPTHVADNQSSRSVQSVSWSIESKGDAESTSVVEAVLEKPVAKPRSESCFIFDQEKDIFQSSEENLDVDLFAPTKPTEQKKPPGGVSLFGGSSLLGDELRNRLGKAIVPVSPEVLAATPVPDNSSPKEEVLADPKRQPLLRDTRVISVGFDKPADQSKTLISATKGRAKVNAKRRLPSRKKLQTDARCSDGDGQDSAADGVLFPPSHGDAAGVTHSGSDAKPTINPCSLKPALKVIKSPSTEEEDLFSVNSLHPVPAEHKLSQVTGDPAAGSQVPFGKGVFGDDREDDLFATCVESSGKHVTSSHGQSSSGAIFGAEGAVLHWSDDCLPENTAASRDAKAPPQKAPRKVSSNIFEDYDNDDDDIFASKFEKSGKSALSSQAKRNTLFSDDNDDIFSSMPANVSMVEKKGSQPTTRKCLPRTTNFKDPLLGDNSD